MYLEWLWDSCCHPILEALSFRETPSRYDWPHVWWIPTELLAQQPLHAAGYHTKQNSNSVLERVISSYTTSIKALLHGRRKPDRRSPEDLTSQALLIVMPETPDLSINGDLQFVDDEANIFRDFSVSP